MGCHTLSSGIAAVVLLASGLGCDRLANAGRKDSPSAESWPEQSKLKADRPKLTAKIDVVFLTTTWCPVCKKVPAVIAKLKSEFPG